MSQKYSLFAEKAGQLQQRGVKRRDALMLVAAKTAVPLGGEWLEAFWCQECQKTTWYHVHKHESSYELSVAPAELWQQATGVAHPEGNPTVGEFTRRQARMLNYKCIQDFKFIN
jgi:hypothetical protein